MSETTKTLLAGGAVALAAGMIFAGAELRDRVDLGGSSARIASISALRSTWVASRDNDVNVPVGDFYFEMTKLLKQQYVEPISDDMKLASGSVRGMIASLGDPRSLYFDKEEFRTYLNARRGKYDGIGADLALQLLPGEAKRSRKTAALPKLKINETGDAAVESSIPDPTDPEEAVAVGASIPRLVVDLVVPGSPADKAGMRAGDVIQTVDNHWVVEGSLLQHFRDAQRQFEAKKITFDQINTLRKELKKKTDRAMMPLKARDRLMTGASGEEFVEWERDGKSFSARIPKGVSLLPTASSDPGALLLRFDADAVEKLKEAVVHHPVLKIDLRNNLHGDFDSMRACLAVLAPAGTYGAIVTERAEKPASLTLVKGAVRQSKVTLITDRTTEGAAAIFALALSSKGHATLIGSEVGGDRAVTETVELPDGSGYSLVTGTYRASQRQPGAVASREGVTK